MGLLTEIQNEAVSDNSNVTTLLRKCLVLAARLGSDVLEDWVKYELNGYPPEAVLPEYRILPMVVKGYFSGPFGSYIQNVPIPPLLIKNIIKSDALSHCPYRQAVTTIRNDEDARKASTMKTPLDDLILCLGDKISEGYNAVSIWGEIPSMQVINIIEAVKNRVLELALALEKNYPNADEVNGMTKTDQQTKQDVQGIAHNVIYGNVGFLGTANNSSVTVNFNSGNMEELKNYLEQQKVSETDIEELETAIQAEPQIKNSKQFGSKVAAWVGKMTSKAASGAWDVSVSAGGAILQAAILRYYGLN